MFLKLFILISITLIKLNSNSQTQSKINQNTDIYFKINIENFHQQFIQINHKNAENTFADQISNKKEFHLIQNESNKFIQKSNQVQKYQFLRKQTNGFQRYDIRILTQIQGCLVYEDILTNKTCKQCNSGYTLTPVLTCSTCTQYCLTCIFNTTTLQTQCTQCTPALNIATKDYLFYQKHCYNQDDSFLNILKIISFDKTSKSIGCPSSCLTCSLKNGTFRCSIVLSGFNSIDNLTLHLKPCTKNCYACSQNISICLSCATGYVLTNNSCIRCIDLLVGCRSCTISPIQSCSYCIQKYYLQNGTCHKCLDNCGNCSDSTHCYTCIVGHFKYSNTLTNLDECIECIQGCADCKFNNQTIVCVSCYLTYFLDSTGYCSPCGSNCRTCQSLTFCTKCLLSYVLLTGVCYKQIKRCNLYYWNGTCYQCQIGYLAQLQVQLMVFYY